MFDIDQLRHRLEEALPNAQISIDDLTGGGDHFSVKVVATAFEGVGHLARHRMVYAPLKSILGGAVHALALSTHTPAEAQAAAAKSPLRIHP
jgi:stress-induced morphogen